MINNHDYTFKIITIGNPSVGKSSIINNLINKSFDHRTISTLGVEFNIKTLTINDNSVKLLIWDTAGQERFKSIISAYYRNVHGIVLVYDITKRKSFDDLNVWLNEINKYCNEDVAKVLIGNKSDLSLDREVTYNEGQQLAINSEMIFIETSAKTSEGIEDSFAKMIIQIINNLNINANNSTHKFNNAKPLKIIEEHRPTDNCECQL